MGSPATAKLKWPGSMIPACTGPTGIWKTPSPSVGRYTCCSPSKGGRTVSIGKFFRKGCTSGQLSCRATRRGLGWIDGHPQHQVTAVIPMLKHVVDVGARLFHGSIFGENADVPATSGAKI